MKSYVFFDMDGVLAKWECNGDSHAKGFMLSRKPDQAAIDLALALKERGEVEVAILSAVYNTDAELEKIEWLERVGLGGITHLFVPYGSNKAEAIEAFTAPVKVLIDDYTKNLEEWESSGNRSVKYRNGINGTKGTWGKRPSISHEMDLDNMIAFIEEIAA